MSVLKSIAQHLDCRDASRQRARASAIPAGHRRL